MYDVKTWHFIGTLNRYENGFLQETIEHGGLLSSLSPAVILESDHKKMVDEIIEISNGNVYARLNERFEDAMELENQSLEIERLRKLLKDLLEDTQHYNHDCKDSEENCPVLRARNYLK